MMLNSRRCCCVECPEVETIEYVIDSDGSSIPLTGSSQYHEIGSPDYVTLRIPNATPSGFYKLELDIRAFDVNNDPDEQAAYSVEFGGYTFRAESTKVGSQHQIEITVTDSLGDPLVQICPIALTGSALGNYGILGTLSLHKYSSGTHLSFASTYSGETYTWVGLTLDSSTDVIFNPESSIAAFAFGTYYWLFPAKLYVQPAPNACFSQPVPVATERCCPSSLETWYCDDEYTLDVSGLYLPSYWDNARPSGNIPLFLATGFTPINSDSPVEVVNPDDGLTYYWQAFGTRNATFVEVDCDGEPLEEVTLNPAIGPLRIEFYQLSMGSKIINAQVCLTTSGHACGDATVNLVISGNCLNVVNIAGNPVFDPGTGTGSAGQASVVDAFIV